MASNGDAVLGALLGHLARVHVSADQLAGKLGKVKVAAIGALGVFAGTAALKGIWDLVKGAEGLNKELNKTLQLGGDFAKTVDQARATAFRVAGALPTSTPEGNVRLAREVGSTLGHPDQAFAMLGDAEKAAYVAANYTGEDPDNIAKNLMRVADARGQIFSTGPDGKEHVDATKLQAELEAAVKGLILGAGFITSSDLLQMARQAGPAAKTQTPEAFYAAGVEAGVQMGASKAGTAEMGLYQQFIGGTMTKKVAEHLTEAGILNPNDWHSGRSGGVVVNPSVAGRFTGMTQDPEKYFAEGEGASKIKAFAEKEGITAMMAVFQLFGRQTVQRLISDMMTNAPQFARAREIFGGIGSVKDQYAMLQDKDLDTNMKGLQNAWTGLISALGEQGIPLAIRMMQDLTTAIHKMTDYAVAHPEAAKAMLETAAGIAALVAVGGGLTVIAVALGALTTAVTGAASAAGGLALIAVRLTALAGPVGAFLAALGITNQANKGETEQLDSVLGKPDATGHRSGGTIKPQTFVPPPGSRYGAPGYGAPMPVIVTNPRDIAKGAVGAVNREMSRPPTGPTGPDPRGFDGIAAALGAGS